MRFINDARHEEEQNVIAYQYRGNINCRTLKSIYPAVELLAGCEQHYPTECGTDTNSEGKLFVLFDGVIIIPSILLYFQLRLPIFVALAVKNCSQHHLHLMST